MTKYLKAQNPLLLRLHRLMDAFAKSDDERDFYLDKVEGFILFADLDKSEEDYQALINELSTYSDRYCLIPKLSFYEVKKIMEGFVNEKVYDIDTKEKLLEVIQSKDAREQFLEFIYDNEAELEKWQQYYQERSRVRIIEWLRLNAFQFVFEEDLELSSNILEALKTNLFEEKVPKDLQQARQVLFTKSKTYYSNEALNPRPKRGRPPKQVAKVEIETPMACDIFTQVPASVRRFLYLPLIQSGTEITFSEKFDTEAAFLDYMRGGSRSETQNQLAALSEKFASLKQLSSKLGLPDTMQLPSFDEPDEDEEDVFAAAQQKKSRKPKKVINVEPIAPRKKTPRKKP
ncbi:MAG: UPF0158 family protein [Verrucomicrobia bacterium]|nr:UPF0158 family protein [Verrucomicrobiota bacterium]MBS0646607.1 UPF0158 family protein [Verrucomicrobiota bacterium]